MAQRQSRLDCHVLVSSAQDLAGITIADYLKSNAGFTKTGKSFRSSRHKKIELYVASGSLLILENLDDLFPNASSFIFLSKHKSNSQIPALTCHCTGNFGNNPYGGNPREIAISYPCLQKGYLQAIAAAREKVPEYDITIEATHHGPTSLKKPVLFVELGSCDKQWTDSNAAAVICDTLLDLLEIRIEHCDKVGIALGGTHYPTKFTKLLLETGFGLAAVASKHNLDDIDDRILDQMIEKSIEKVTHIVVDSKGLGSQKDRIMKMVGRSGLEIYKL